MISHKRKRIYIISFIIIIIQKVNIVNTNNIIYINKFKIWYLKKAFKKWIKNYNITKDKIWIY